MEANALLRCGNWRNQMDKKLAGLLGAVAGLATVSSAQAATGPAPNQSGALQASTYADLLAPISNAAALLKAEDEARAQQQAEVQLAQVYYTPYPYPPPYGYYHRHHHHHHHSYWRRYSHHHHHHHHHHGFVGIPGVGGVIIR
jgi:hypothetical protein